MAITTDAFRGKRTSANTDELDKPLMRMNLINDLLRVCDKNTTLGEIAENSSYHTTSPQHRWLSAMPAGNTLQWLLDNETYLHPGDAARRQKKKDRWNTLIWKVEHLQG